MINYLQFTEQLKEGLIFTHNIEKYKSSLEIQLSNLLTDFDIDIESKFIFNLNLKNTNNVNNEILKHIPEMILNLFGYYPSYMWITNNKNNINYFKFDDKYLNNKYCNIKIRFEAKYDDGICKNTLDVPPKAYHLTPQKNKKRILKIGLYPKTFNRNTRHPERIYLFYDINKYESLLKTLKISDLKNDNDYNYILLEINMNKNMVIHSDSNYTDGFFTYDNISVNDIKILKEYL